LLTSTLFPYTTLFRSLAAGTAYFVVNNALVSLALALEGHERWWTVWRERFAWLLTHYFAYGFVGGVMALGYDLEAVREVVREQRSEEQTAERQARGHP